MLNDAFLLDEKERYTRRGPSPSEIDYAIESIQLAADAAQRAGDYGLRQRLCQSRMVVELLKARESHASDR